MLRKIPLFVFATCWCLGCMLSAKQPYQPENRSAIRNPLMWARQEIADDKRIVTVTVAPDDSVWMGFEKGYIVHASATETTEYRIFDNNDYPRILSLCASKNGDVYATGTDKIYYLNGEEWITVDTPITEGLTTQPMVEFEDGTIWYSNLNGLGTLKKGKYEHVIHTRSAILSICEIHLGKVWILSENGEKLFEANKDQNQLAPQTEWKLVAVFPPSPKSGGRLFKDQSGYIWIINANLECPVHRYDPTTRNWVSFELSKLGGDNYNNDITQTPDGNIWISGRSSLHSFDGQEWEIFEQSDGIPSSYRMEVESDPKGFLYVLDGGTSLFRIDLLGAYYYQLQGLHFQTSSTHHNWYASYKGTVISENKSTHVWTEYTQDDNLIETVLFVAATSKGDIVCIGSENGEAAISILANGKQRWNKLSFPAFAETFARDSFHELEDGSFLLGSMPPENELTTDKTRGILLLKKTSAGFESSSFMPENAPEVAINIHQTSDGRFWTNHFGVSTFSADSPAKIYRPQEWYFNWVEQMAITDDDKVWLSLWGLGIYSLKDEKWTHYSDAKGLTTKSTNQLIRLEDDTLVTSTDVGLFRFDGHHWIPFLDKSLVMYRDTGTLMHNKSTLWINRTNSDWYERWSKEVVVGPSMEASFSTLRYQPDDEGPDTYLIADAQIETEKEHLHLKWNGLDSWSKTPKERLQFSVKLDNGEWSKFASQTSIDLENLSHGFHTFEVKARDEDFNIDDSPAHLTIMVSLPFWKQPWFYFIVGTILLGIGFLIATIIRLKIKHIEELDELRNHFFINLSHELRTPISLISIPIEKLKRNGASDEQRKHLSMMELNIRRLSVLVDQLLDFRAIEKGKLKFNSKTVDLSALLSSQVEVFQNQALQKQLEINFHSSHSHCITHFDPDIFQKIADNLISNAIKYTPEGGQVQILLAIKSDSVTNEYTINLTVEDNGNGIHPEIQKHIFEPFYRGKNGLTNKGYGIGLALVKEILDSLKGSIAVESPIFNKDSEHPGSRFIASFPIEKPNQLIESNAADDIKITSVESDENPFFDPIDKTKNRLLLVEDNLELRNMIGIELSNDYNLLTAADGKHGLETAVEHIPDVIIADVMMPEMDGFEFTKMIKSDPTTAHIPVILLTALKSTDHQKQGLDVGADDYLTKPISTEILLIKIRNLLQTREQLKARVREQFGIAESTTQLDTHTTAFMAETSAIIENNIDNPDFDVDALAKQMGMSRSGFYRKFEAVSGEQPANFIRSTRMKHAAKLLREASQNITEIALSVGFTEAANFSRAFKQFYKVSPSKYRNQK